ncbi:MAG: hypothetical protein ACTSRS_06135 [Candidatus Helarchaeota archaeon]
MTHIQRKYLISIGLILLLFSPTFTLYFNPFIKGNISLQESVLTTLQGPEIYDVTITPEYPKWDDNVTITAQITDPWGILEAWINYDADNDAYAGWGANFTMSHVADDTYTYEILNSIWDPPWGPAHGSYVNFTIFAKNGLGEWSHSNYYQFYMNDTIKPVINILTLTNHSYVSGNFQINTTIIEEGSGVKQANLSIFMGNGTLSKQFTSTNLNETFLWDVSSLPDYNASNPASYYTINFTVWDNANPPNWATILLEDIRIDNTAPYLASINSYKNRTAFVQDNQTLTTNIISASNFQNDISVTHQNNSTYHTFYNGSSGFLQVAYGFNLSSWNITVDMINTLQITLDGKISYSNSSILAAGWKIWNWIHQNFTIIHSTIFNTTTDISDTLFLSIFNKSLYVNANLSNRIEIFFFVNTTGPSISGSIDFISYNITYFKTDDWYNRDNENITLRIAGDDLLSFDRIELHYENYTYYIFNSSGIHILDFNTTVLPDGFVPLNVTVYDKAGNSNSSSLFINIDYIGPIVTISSPINNSYIGESGVWNLIVPVELSGYDIAKNFKKMELWIDGSLAPVVPGQLGQIIEYDEFGNITYQQQNATWYKEGNYTYYWNASLLAHNSTHELKMISYDGFNNLNFYHIFIKVAIFQINISIIDVGENYSTSSDHAIILEFTITNNGNSTLMNFAPQLVLPTYWEWNFKDITSFDFQFLRPGNSFTFKIQIIPRSVQSHLNQTILLQFSCKLVENLTQTTNYFSFQLTTYVIVEPDSPWGDIQATVFFILSILIGLGVGLLGWYLYQYMRRVYIQPPLTSEKEKKGKK